MSFNHGGNRNSFGNRNRNRNGGGGGGGGNMGGRNNMGGGMMASGGGGGGGGVNPWESGIMPGRGLLPTPNNNLSLSSSQAQLVIASNLLTNLLRNQQDVQPQVPSLLSLGNNLNGPGPNFGNQQNFGQGRFNDRPMRHPLKNQRSQPYNKMGNRARDGAAGRRGPSAQQPRASQSANQRINGNQNQHRNDKASKANSASKQNQTGKKEQQEVKSSDKETVDETPVAKSDENESTEDKKRDWKNEKKEGEIIQQETAAESKEGTAETVVEESENPEGGDKKTEDGQAGGKKSATRHAESRYAAVPMSNMYCHVCNKHMWDGFSFENHLRGRAHQLMMEKLDESYKLKVDLMRHELRVSEEQRELALTNSKRRGKKVTVDLNVREYCTMCDLNFFGTLSTHRRSDKHQQLKTFLHPRCFLCTKEFPSRIEYDEHCLTPVHMKSTVQSEEQKKNKKKDKLAKGESEVRTAEDEEKDSAPEPKTTEKEEEVPENTVYITDLSEDMQLTNSRVPSLKHCRQNQITVGKSLVKEVQGWECEKCRRFMLTETAMNAHLRSNGHYKNFVQEFKARVAAANEEAKAAAEAASEETKKTEKDGAAKEQESKEEEEDEDYEGDWKRRKVDHSKNEDVSMTEDTTMPAPQTNENSSDGKKEATGDQKYDPLEADAESEAEGVNATKDSDVSANCLDIHDKSTPVDEMWADLDNDNEMEIGNLIDDDEDEKEIEEVPIRKPEPEKKPVETVTPAEVVEKPVEKTPAISSPAVKAPSTPVVNAPSTPVVNAPSTPVVNAPSTPVVNAPSTPVVNAPSTPVVNAPAVNSPVVNSPAVNSPAVKSPAVSSPQVNSQSPVVNTPQGKTPRGGRNYGRGRGSQRARRSRR